MKSEHLVTFFHVEVLKSKGGGWEHIGVFNNVSCPAQNANPISYVVADVT